MSVFRVGSNKSSVNNFPSVRPTLDLDFANSKTLDPRITFTRASGGSYTGADGLIKYAGVNEARFDHNPTTGESLGLLVEEQRTNSVTNNTMVGAVAGTPGTNPTGWIYATTSSNGLTLSIVGTGVENGVNYIDYRFNGTTVASPAGCSMSVVNATAATGQTWTASTYWKLAAGTATGTTSWQIGLIEATAGAAFVTGAFYTQTAPTSAALITQRPAATRTLSGGATVGAVNCPFVINVAGNTAIDFTIRIGLPQLEQGAFATSVIPTTTSTRTRAADNASITGKNFSEWYRQDEGTVFVNYKGKSQEGTSYERVYSINLNSTANVEEILLVNNIGYNPDRIGYLVYDNSVAIQDTTGTTGGYVVASSSPVKTAMCYKTADYAYVFNGGTVIAGNVAGVPTVNTLDIGRVGAGSQLNGTISRLTYYPKRLTNAQLQALTK